MPRRRIIRTAENIIGSSGPTGHFTKCKVVLSQGHPEIVSIWLEVKIAMFSKEYSYYETIVLHIAGRGQ